MDQPENLFKDFVKADSFETTVNIFKRLLKSLNINPEEYGTVYDKLKGGVKTEEAQRLWKLLDKRAHDDVYGDGEVCKTQKVFIIGAGPCGLRMAIEARLLGSQVVVVEMRNYVTRNNVLHLWPFVVHDLKSLGAKIFYRKFCTGSLDHISIRRLQATLLKIALVLGAEIHAPVKFTGLNEPNDSDRGWTASLEPKNHPASHYEFNFIIGADGKKNSLSGFKKKCLRPKQALAITFNLVNNNTKADHQVEEIPGRSYVYHQDFFQNLKEKADVELENIVYFRDETHYFVMTAKKSSLLKRRVLKKDLKNTRELLSWDNINRDEMKQFSLDVASIVTRDKIPTTEFAKDHHDEDDVALFDFTAMTRCEYSTIFREKFGQNLVLNLVGDGLIEPFWPTGSGAARGFLSVLDSAWLLRSRGLGKSPLECIAEKESCFHMLVQCSPSDLKKPQKYTINPQTRYKAVADKVFLTPNQVKHLYLAHDDVLEDVPEGKQCVPTLPRKKATKRSYSSDSSALLKWYQEILSPFKDIFTVVDLDSSWKDGRALCGIVSLYRPTLINMSKIKVENACQNIEMALDIIQSEFDLDMPINPEDILNESGDNTMNKLVLQTFLMQLQECLNKEENPNEPPAKKMPPSVMLMEFLKKEPELMGMEKQPPKKKHIHDNDIHIRSTANENGTNNDVVSETSEDTIEACYGIASTRIKDMEKKLLGKFKRDMKTAGGKDGCFVCGEKIKSFFERVMESGHLIHKACFRCDSCRCTLRQGNGHISRPQGDQLVKFYCFRHAHEAGLFKVAKRSQSSSNKINAPTDTYLSSSSDDEFLDALDDVDNTVQPPADNEIVLRRKVKDPNKTERPETEYRHSTSIRLLLTQEIQDGLEDLEYEEKELEERGKQVEETIHSQEPGTPVDDPNIMEEWIEIIEKRKELKEKESKLVLQLKLLQLQERQKGLLQENTTPTDNVSEADMEEEGEERDEVDDESTDLETEITAIKQQIHDLGLYLETVSDTDN